MGKENLHMVVLPESKCFTRFQKKSSFVPIQKCYHRSFFAAWIRRLGNFIVGMVLK